MRITKSRKLMLGLVGMPGGVSVQRAGPLWRPGLNWQGAEAGRSSDRTSRLGLGNPEGGKPATQALAAILRGFSLRWKIRHLRQSGRSEQENRPIRITS